MEWGVWLGGGGLDRRLERLGRVGRREGPVQQYRKIELKL